jgi:hypothetical protein
MKHILIFGFFLILLGCNSDSNSIYAVKHFKFNTEDKKLLIKYNYAEGQIITYQNQFGEQLHFKVLLNEIKKFGDYTSGTFSGGGGILESYYDGKIIRMEIIENEAGFLQEQIIYNFSKSEDRFKSGVQFPIWNLNENAFFDEQDRPFNIGLNNYFYNTKIQITLNGHTFQKVVTINSNDNNVLSPSFGALLTNNINKLYYDFDFGIVQFNDIDGKEWKVIYPQ